jgi:pyrroloquinoline quinone biosynthesis protein E
MDVLDTIERKNVKLFVLNGGEPLLYPEILLLLKRINKMDTTVNIFSSGYGLTEDIITILKKSKNIYFYISLNSSTKTINQLSREGYDVALEAIAILDQKNTPYGINWVARHDNAADFINMMALCRKYNARYLSIVGNKLTGANTMDSPLTQKDLEEIATRINNRKEQNPAIFIESCFSILTTHINIRKSGYGAHCYAGVNNCNINCDLTFQPCTHLKVPECFNTIEDYWHSSVILKTLRENPAHNLEPCRQCGHRRICSLCRATDTKTSSNLTANSQSCINYFNGMTGV